MATYNDIVEYRDIIKRSGPGITIPVCSASVELFRFITNLLGYMNWPSQQRRFDKFSAPGDANSEAEIAVALIFADDKSGAGQESEANARKNEFVAQFKISIDAKGVRTITVGDNDPFRYEPDLASSVEQSDGRISIKIASEPTEAIYERASAMLLRQAILQR